jgi:hypothetical protein
MPNEISMSQPGALAEIPFSVDEMAADTELGGKLSLQDIAVPYLYILQTNSPQVNPDHAKYIKNATAGMLYLSNIEQVFNGRDTGLPIVPCFYERLVNEWIPRNLGGGLVASLDPEADILKTCIRREIDGKEVLVRPDNGHHMIETAYHYFLVGLERTWVQTICPFKSTALKVSRRMNSNIATTMIPGTDKKAPRFLYKWQFTTIKEQADEYVWSSPKLEKGGMVSADVYAAAKAFAQIAAKGVLRRAAVEAEQEGGGHDIENSPV